MGKRPVGHAEPQERAERSPALAAADVEDEQVTRAVAEVLLDAAVPLEVLGQDRVTPRRIVGDHVPLGDPARPRRREVTLVAAEPRARVAHGEHELAAGKAPVELAVEVAAVPGSVVERLEALGDREDRLVLAALVAVPQRRVPALVPEPQLDEGTRQRARPRPRRADAEHALVPDLPHCAARGRATLAAPNTIQDPAHRGATSA